MIKMPKWTKFKIGLKSNNGPESKNGSDSKKIKEASLAMLENETFSSVFKHYV